MQRRIRECYRTSHRFQIRQYCRVRSPSLDIHSKLNLQTRLPTPFKCSIKPRSPESEKLIFAAAEQSY